MATEPQHSEIMSGETTSSAMTPARADVVADTALIVEALGRIEAAARTERAALDRLRTSLSKMAKTIAKAKAMADSETAAALLDEFEHRIDAMIEIAGGPVPAASADAAPAPAAERPPAPAEPEPPANPAAQGESRVQLAEVTYAGGEPPAEADQVPTVSGVVSRLGPGHDPFNEGVVNALHATGKTGDQGPTVAMLKAMVEALTVPAVQEAVAEAIAEAAPTAQEPAAEVAPPPDVAMAADAAPVSWTGNAADDAGLHEGALLASFEQMGVRPFATPEEGTAVIFASRTETGPPPELVPEPLAPSEPVMPPPEPDATAAASPEPTASEPIAPAPEAVPARETAPETAAAAMLADPDFDPTDFLFGPEPEPDPAAFLLDPAPPPRAPKALALPQPEFVAPPARDAEAAPETAPKASPETAPQAADAPAAPAPHDPLHALKAMSPEEKIALFT